MISTKLYDDIVPFLKDAEEVWVAVALLKERALNAIQVNLPSNAIQHYLIGIDLPTSPEALYALKNMSKKDIHAAIYIGSKSFHPKVYLIRKNRNLAAFIGSSNATSGGFTRNIEMNFLVTDQMKCKELLAWFKKLFDTAEQLTEDFIINYEKTFKKNKALTSAIKSNNDRLKNQNQSLKGGSIVIEPGQFFRQTDFAAYIPRYHYDSSEKAESQRQQVRLRFLELDQKIFPQFGDYGILDLHHPNNRAHYTSQYFVSARSKFKDALWLQYGKSQRQLRVSPNKKFTDNERIQVILRNKHEEAYVGTWLIVGKPNQSYADRKNIKAFLVNDYYMKCLYQAIIALGDSYHIRIGGEHLEVADIENLEQLSGMLQKDSYDDYFIIGRNYHPNDPALSNENIAETILAEFSRLFRVYDLFRKK